MHINRQQYKHFTKVHCPKLLWPDFIYRAIGKIQSMAFFQWKWKIMIKTEIQQCGAKHYESGIWILLLTIIVNICLWEWQIKITFGLLFLLTCPWVVHKELSLWYGRKPMNMIEFVKLQSVTRVSMGANIYPRKPLHSTFVPKRFLLSSSTPVKSSLLFSLLIKLPDVQFSQKCYSYFKTEQACM